MFVKLLIISAVLIGVSGILIGIKMILKKGSMFKKTCASIEFENGEKVGCTCKAESGEKCRNYEEHHNERKKKNDFN